jgi:hypothetical protein
VNETVFPPLIEIVHDPPAAAGAATVDAAPADESVEPGAEVEALPVLALLPQPTRTMAMTAATDASLKERIGMNSWVQRRECVAGCPRRVNRSLLGR